MCACACLSLAVSPGFSLSWVDTSTYDSAKLKRLRCSIIDEYFVLFLPLPLVQSFCCFSCLLSYSIREEKIIKGLWAIVSFSRKTAMIFSFFFSSLSLCPNTFGFSHFHLLFGETCQLQQPSLVHLAFKLMLHFFSDTLVLCKHTHCFFPLSLEYCEVEQMGFKTNCHLHLIHSAHCYIKGSSYILLFCLLFPVYSLVS